MIRPLLALTAAAIGAAGLSAPAAAQDGEVKINQIYIQEGEECPASTDEIITVCGVLEDPYRIPANLRRSDSPQNESWGERAKSFQMVGEFGIMSCSPTGAGGWTGCTQKMIEEAYAEKRNSDGVLFSQLIEEERQKRLATIDAEAAEEQERVEMIEREYEARLAAERGEPLPDETPDETPDTGMIDPSQPVELDANGGPAEVDADGNAVDPASTQFIG